MQLIGRRYDNAQLVCIETEGQRIADVTSWRAKGRSSLPWIAPGLIDLQVNGWGGLEFTVPSLTIDHVQQISLAMNAFGVTGYLATVTTQAPDVMTHALGTIAAASEVLPTVRDRLLGIHLEGPYLSREDGPRGAHPRAYCQPPNWDQFQRFQEAARGQLRMLTMSPEFPDADRFVRLVVDSGVVVAIGHTNANSDQIRACVDAGARLSTHLGNGAHARIQRHPNYIWDQLADDRLTATLIADGHHLPAAVIKSFMRVKTPERAVLISDITGMGGLPPGCYDRGHFGQVEVLGDGRVVMAGQTDYLAGASLPISAGITNLMQFADLDLAAALDMTSERPARLINAPPVILERGAVADLIQFRLPEDGGPIQIETTINKGQTVYSVDPENI